MLLNQLSWQSVKWCKMRNMDMWAHGGIVKTACFLFRKKNGQKSMKMCIYWYLERVFEQLLTTEHCPVSKLGLHINDISGTDLIFSLHNFFFLHANYKNKGQHFSNRQG